MTLLARLESRFRHLAIPNLTLILCGGCLLSWILIGVQPARGGIMPLDPAAVLGGQVWRLFTFVIMPPTLNPLWLFFALYIFWLTGSALERQWGAFRYNVYVLIWWLATVSAAFLVMLAGPAMTTSGLGLPGTVFLAFAFLYLNFEFRLFFLIPVRVKWLALLTWIMYGWAAVNGAIEGHWALVATIAASLLNFALFFARPILQGFAARERRRQFAAAVQAAPRTRHRCGVCGVTELDDAQMEFRYCSQCSEPTAYCTAHLRAHEHV